MKRIIIIGAVAIGTLFAFGSCKKEEIEACKCGEVVEMYKNTIGNNPNTQLTFGKFYVVKNYCSGETKEFKTTADGYDKGQKYCSDKKW